MPFHHVTGLGFVSHQSPVLSSWDTPSAQATIPSACSLSSSEELLGKRKAGRWLGISSAECSPEATAAMSVIRMLSYSSFSQHLVQDFSVLPFPAFSPAVQGWFSKHTALTAPAATLAFWQRCCGTGRIPGTSQSQPEFWVISQGLAGIWARQAPCKSKHDGELPSGALAGLSAKDSPSRKDCRSVGRCRYSFRFFSMFCCRRK